MIFSYAPDDASHNEICGSSVDSDVADSGWFLTKEVSWEPAADSLHSDSAALVNFVIMYQV